jgi:hypothetical protein
MPMPLVKPYNNWRLLRMGVYNVATSEIDTVINKL